MNDAIEPAGRWPHYSEQEIDAVTAVLRSGKVNYWTGSEGRRFEQEFADYIGTRHGIALANGTLALELCLRVLDIGPGDEVIVTPRSFVASASVIVQVGATPVFADIDPVSQNLDPEAAEAAITGRTKAIILVHLAGWPCDMDAFQAIAEKHHVHLVEDCAQAHGARYKGKTVGSFGTVSAFSFCQDKIMSTGGEGGMFLCNDEALYKRAWSYKDHGKNPDKIVNAPHSGASFRWLHDSIGSNWRMTEMQASIGQIQLSQLEANLNRRAANAARYTQIFNELPGIRSTPAPGESGTRHAYYVYYLRVDAAALVNGWTRDRILELANLAQPVFRSGACPEIYREAAFLSLHPTETPACSRAAALGEETIMLPCHHHLTDVQRADFAHALTKVLSDAVSRPFQGSD